MVESSGANQDKNAHPRHIIISMTTINNRTIYNFNNLSFDINKLRRALKARQIFTSTNLFIGV